MYCFGSDFFCFKTQGTANIIRQIITYTIIFLPLVIGMTIGAVYGKNWDDPKYRNLKKPAYNPPSCIWRLVSSIVMRYMIVYAFLIKYQNAELLYIIKDGNTG